MAGDVKADDVVAQIREAYSKSKARAIPPMVLPEEPRQTAAREIIEEAPIELGHVHLSWHIPELRHPDVPALDVLAVVLGSGRSSRLYQELREKKGRGQFDRRVDVQSGQRGAAGHQRAGGRGQIHGGAGRGAGGGGKGEGGFGFRGRKSSKAVKQFVSATLATRKTMQGQAADLGGSWLAANDLNFSERYLAAVKRVTPADLRRVAREYLTTGNRTIVRAAAERRRAEAGNRRIGEPGAADPKI